MSATSPRSYRLTSCEAVHSPGLVRWLRHVARTHPTLAQKLLLASFPELPLVAAARVLRGPLSVEADTVVVTV